MTPRGAIPLLSAMLAGAVTPLGAQRPATQHLVWPPPPEVARIEYVGSLSSERDFGKSESFFSKLKRSLLGGAPPSMLAIERPFDILGGSDGRLFVTDGTTPAVFEFALDDRKARLIGEDVPGGLRRPMGMGGDAAGRLYVTDAAMARVVVFGADGTFERVFGGPNVLLNPVDVAVDGAAGRYYVVDAYQHQVLVFDAVGAVVQRIGKTDVRLGESPEPAGPPVSAHGDSALASQHAGVPRAVSTEPSDLWQNRGGEPGAFRYPVSLAVASDGTLYVSDQMNFRVQAFDRSGAFERQVGAIGDQPGSFARPKGIAVDREDHLYVVDAAFNNVQIFDAEGALLLAFGELGTGEGRHWMPLGISVDGRDRIWVADRYNNRAQVYQYLADAATAADGTALADPVGGK